MSDDRSIGERDVPDEIRRLLEGHDGLNGQLSQGTIELLEPFLLLRMIFVEREDLIAQTIDAHIPGRQLIVRLELFVQLLDLLDDLAVEVQLKTIQECDCSRTLVCLTSGLLC